MKSSAKSSETPDKISKAHRESKGQASRKPTCLPGADDMDELLGSEETKKSAEGVGEDKGGPLLIG